MNDKVDEWLKEHEKELNATWRSEVVFTTGDHRLHISQNSIDNKYQVIIHEYTIPRSGTSVDTIVDHLHPFDTFIAARDAGNRWIAELICKL